MNISSKIFTPLMGVSFVIISGFILLSCAAEVSNSDLEESSSEQESSSSTVESSSIGSSEIESSSQESSSAMSSSSDALFDSSSEDESSVDSSVIGSSESSSVESSSSSIPTVSDPEWESNGSLYSITYNDYKIEIDASVGGRVIEFSLSGNNIIMYGDDDKGSIFWLSPQSAWPGSWPPSAEIDDSTYSAELNDDNTLLTLTSGVDSISGMTVEKQFSYNAANERVDITYTIINTSDSVQEVAPWANSRCNPGGLTFFPLGELTDVKAPSFDTLPIELIDGVGWVDHQDQSSMKAFKDGAEGWLSHYNDGSLFIQAFEDVAVDDFAPDETEIELYVAEDFIEVEYQGAYKELQPGDRYDFNTQWYLAPVEGSVSIGSAELVSQVRSILGIE